MLSDEPDFLGAGYESRARRASRVSFSDIVVVNEHGVSLEILNDLFVSVLVAICVFLERLQNFEVNFRLTHIHCFQQETPELSLIVVSDPKEIKPIYHRSSSDNTPSSAGLYILSAARPVFFINLASTHSIHHYITRYQSQVTSILTGNLCITR